MADRLAGRQGWDAKERLEEGQAVNILVGVPTVSNSVVGLCSGRWRGRGQHVWVISQEKW